MAKLTLEKFIENSKKKHGTKYDYSRTVYVDSKTKLEIICKQHGSFWQLPPDHYRFGCKKCGLERSGQASSMTTDEFIEKAREVHGQKYDYSKSVYKRLKVPLVVTCRIHGDFETTPFNHIHNKSNCSKCRDDNYRLGLEEFLTRAIFVHGYKYNYSFVNYVNTKTKVKIKCPIHGFFEQRPEKHINGIGCPTCGAKKSSNSRLLTTHEFIKRSKETHGDKYSYKHVDYVNSKTPVMVECKVHGIFSQKPSMHIRGNGCPKCVNHESKLHKYIKDYFKDIVRIEEFNKGLLHGNYEIDLFFPDFNLGVEFNGAYFHSEKFKPKQYHQNKFNYAEERGIQLLQFWDFKETNTDLIISMIRSKLGMTQKIYARKTKAVELPSHKYIEFLKENHIQGLIYSSKKLGLLYEGRLVAVMGFSARKGEVHLDRFCSLKNYTVVGGFSKLLKFANIKNPIITFSDGMYSDGNVYKVHGFTLVKENEPRLYFTNGEIIENRRSFQKSRFKERYPDLYDHNLTEKQLAERAGFFRLWGVGTRKWVLEKP